MKSRNRGAAKGANHRVRGLVGAMSFAVALMSGSALAGDKPIDLVGDATVQIPTAKYFTASNPDQRIDGQYIVVLKEQSGAFASRQAQTSSFASSVQRAHGARVLHRYTGTITGLAVQMDPSQVGNLLKNPDIDYIEEDQTFTISAVQTNPPSWGIDRIDERSLPFDNLYDSDFTGAGVNAFIIDTGIQTNHSQFTGRASAFFDAFNGNGQDCNGHGTHVAGTVGSETFGVAKDVRLFAVRVLDCGGSGSNSGIIAGMDAVANNGARPAVANMSLGGGFSQASNNAVQRLSNAGVTVVVAAGNENQNACNVSPASAPAAITVAASTINDQRASFSNFGSCVDIFGPGQGILSTSLNGGTATLSGTSMASPHIAGIAALVLDRTPNSSPGQVTSTIVNNATTGAISGTNGSPNRLGYMAFLNSGTPPPPPPPPPGNCSFEDNFTTSTGWTIDGSSNCSTGTYVRGNPSRQTSGGVVTQVGGDAGGDGFAVFTARNSSAGVNDVDGGVCVARSPSINVSQTSTLSLDWFHGQRDSGDDGNDFFQVQVSTNGGASFSNLVSRGDARHTAQWARATRSIPAGSNVVIRVRTSDGAGPGDIVEGGIDSVSICR